MSQGYSPPYQQGRNQVGEGGSSGKNNTVYRRLKLCLCIYIVDVDPRVCLLLQILKPPCEILAPPLLIYSNVQIGELENE